VDIVVLLVMLAGGYVVSLWARASVVHGWVRAAYKDVETLLTERLSAAQQLGRMLSTAPFFDAPHALELLNGLSATHRHASVSVQLATDKAVSVAVAQIAPLLSMPMHVGSLAERAEIMRLLEWLQTSQEQLQPLLRVFEMHVAAYHAMIARFPLSAFAAYIGLKRWN
jgi:hypothetical protein